MKLKRLTLVALLIFAMSTFVVGCSDEDENINTTTTTTTESEVTTQEQTTTKEVEITTEEPTTKYIKKGVSILVDKKNAEHFNGLVIESGYTFYINDFITKPEHVQQRGNAVYLLLETLEIDTTEFKAKYFPLGYQSPEIPYEDNYSFTYTGDKKYKFTYMYEKDNGYAYFDFYEVK